MPIQRLVVLNPVTRSVILIEGALTSGQSIKDGALPASKASIEAMPVVKVTELGFECAICLGECGVGEEVKEMPCKHRYHSGCIKKWLGIHGSCPVCRFKMPVEEEGQGNKKGGVEVEVEEEEEEEEDGIWIGLVVVGQIRMTAGELGSRTNSNDGQ